MPVSNYCLYWQIWKSNGSVFCLFFTDFHVSHESGIHNARPLPPFFFFFRPWNINCCTEGPVVWEQRNDCHLYRGQTVFLRKGPKKTGATFNPKAQLVRLSNLPGASGSGWNPIPWSVFPAPAALGAWLPRSVILALPKSRLDLWRHFHVLLNKVSSPSWVCHMLYPLL